MITVLGFIANATSMAIWYPQAKKTYESKKNPYSLKGVSLLTLYLGLINTMVWGVYGLFTKDLWIAMGTIVIAPSTYMTIRWKVEADKKLSELDVKKHDEPKEVKWFSFKIYRSLDSRTKERCLKAKYTTDFHKQIHPEILNWESFESMSDLDKMYWDQDLWNSKIQEVERLKEVVSK